MSKAMIIMAKVPEPGTVKTRLNPYISPEQSAALSEALLKDSVERAGSITPNTFVAFTPKRLADKILRLLGNGQQTILQKGVDLGERMSNAFEEAFARGFERIVMTGTDSPTAPALAIEQSFDLLDGEARAVLGMARDGGFYLIGFDRFPGDVFNGIRWGGQHVFEHMKRNIESAGLNAATVDTAIDIDRPDDLIEVAKTLRSNPELAPETASWILENLPRAMA